VADIRRRVRDYGSFLGVRRWARRRAHTAPLKQKSSAFGNQFC